MTADPTPTAVEDAQALAGVLRSRGKNNSRYDIDRAADLLEALALQLHGGGESRSDFASGSVDKVPDAIMYCKACGTARAKAPCHKCGGDLFKAADGWDEPRIPDIEPIRHLAKECGYAIGMHGSQERDLDLIAAPWTKFATAPEFLADYIAKGINGTVHAPGDKPLGRWACNIQIDGWFKLIDLSVAPRVEQASMDGSELKPETPTLQGPTREEVASPWQDMADAPRDGAVILASWESYRGPRIGTIQYTLAEQWIDAGSRKVVPVRWMPLPALPGGETET